MGRLTRFEDLIAWQKARVLTREVYSATRKGAFSRDFGLAGPIQRAVVSLMANIAGGFERGSRAEFHRFLTTAKGSGTAVRSHLYIAADAGYREKDEFARLMSPAAEVARIVGALRATVEKQRDAPAARTRKDRSEAPHCP